VLPWRAPWRAPLAAAILCGALSRYALVVARFGMAPPRDQRFRDRSGVFAILG
jgi:hypothetical protein